MQRQSSLLFLCLMLAACGGGDAPGTTAIPNPLPESAPTANSCGYSQQEVQTTFLRLVNQVRAAGYTCGGIYHPPVPALAWSGTLETAAQGHSNDMAMHAFTGHTSYDGRSLGTRLAEAGYSWSSAGENVASGFPTIDSVMAGWLWSPAHCSNIMSASYTQIGVACARGSAAAGNQDSRYWTMNFGRPQ